jgi:hypothetical protein
VTGVTEFLAGYGLDASKIAAEGHSAYGYLRFLEPGEGPTEPSNTEEPAKVREPWPVNFNYDEFLKVVYGR